MKINFQNKEYNIEINREHLMRRLGFPMDYELPDHMQETLDLIKEWYVQNGEPWLGIFEISISLDDEKLLFNGIEVDSEKIYKRFNKHGVQNGCIVLATAGEKTDIRIKELWEDYPDESFFLDAYASSVTESLIHFSVNYIKEWSELKGLYSLARYSPGYIGWDLSQQQLLMEIVNDLEKEMPISVMDSSLLYPLKSQISVIGLHKNADHHKEIKIECSTCSFLDCSCRKNHLLKV